MNRATVAMETEQAKDARTSFEKALALRPDSLPAAGNLMEGAWKEGAEDGFWSYANRYIEILATKNTMSAAEVLDAYRRASFLLDSVSLPEGTEMITGILVEGKNKVPMQSLYPQILVLRGVALRELKDYENAARCLRGALGIAPESVDAILELSSVYAKQGMAREAIDTLARVRGRKDDERIRDFPRLELSALAEAFRNAKRLDRPLYLRFIGIIADRIETEKDLPREQIRLVAAHLAENGYSAEATEILASLDGAD